MIPPRIVRKRSPKWGAARRGMQPPLPRQNRITQVMGATAGRGVRSHWDARCATAGIVLTRTPAALHSATPSNTQLAWTFFAGGQYGAEARPMDRTDGPRPPDDRALRGRAGPGRGGPPRGLLL